MRLISTILAASTMLVSVSAQSEVSQGDFNRLEAQYEELAKKVDDKSEDSWSDRIGISGDFRYRYENIDEDSKDDRKRSRVRARTAIVAKMPNKITIGLGLASGGDDPVSTNQTLGGGGSTKDIRMDLAYASWEGLSNTVITIGKFKNPLVRVSGMLWDGDWRPEGMTAGWSDEHIFGTAIASWLEGDSKNGIKFFWGAQGGWKGEMNGTSFMVGVSYFDMGTKGENSIYGSVDDFWGNSFTCVDMVTPAGCTYDIDYQEVEVFAEASTTIADQPVKVFADFVQNQDAHNNDTGWTAGFKIGKAKDSGKWEVGYLYEDLEADAALGLVADSDFGGGGTDVKGHKISAGYGLSKIAVLKATYFINEIGATLGNKHDYNRLQLDIEFKFK